MSIGSAADSMYEYMIKQWVLSGKTQEVGRFVLLLAQLCLVALGTAMMCAERDADRMYILNMIKHSMLSGKTPEVGIFGVVFSTAVICDRDGDYTKSLYTCT
jgi:hypothetical protein